MVKHDLVLPVGGSKFKQIKHTLAHINKKQKKPILLKKKRDALFPYILYIMWYTMQRTDRGGCLSADPGSVYT